MKQSPSAMKVIMLAVFGIISPMLTAHAASEGTVTSTQAVNFTDFNKTIDITISSNVVMVWKTAPSTVVLATKHTKGVKAWGMDSDWEGLHFRSDLGRGNTIQLSDIPSAVIGQDNLLLSPDWQ